MALNSLQLTSNLRQTDKLPLVYSYALNVHGLDWQRQSSKQMVGKIPPEAYLCAGKRMRVVHHKVEAATYIQLYTEPGLAVY